MAIIDKLEAELRIISYHSWHHRTSYRSTYRFSLLFSARSQKVLGNFFVAIISDKRNPSRRQEAAEMKGKSWNALIARKEEFDS